MMKCYQLAPLSLSLLFFATSGYSLEPPKSEPEPAPWRVVQSKIEAWHEVNASEDSKKQPVKPLLRVVYFHGNDMQPLANYQERLTRVMDDISEFYRVGMRKHGMECNGIPLEKDAEKQLIIHVVKGQREAAHYDYKSGKETEAEIRKALAGKVDFDREFALVLYGQCWKMEDGRHGFYSPYYGKVGSNQRWGFCHAADCHLLDPKLLKDTKNRFKYWEHYGDRDQTVAKFNSFYIGGIAHELGHGLGLPHNGESPLARFKQGNSLMGRGNLTYREELWNPRSKGSFLSLASAVRLASHPLITGSNAGRFDKARGGLTNLKTEADGKLLTITSKVDSKIPCYAVIAYIDPKGGGDYDAQTVVFRPGKDGTIPLPNLKIPTGDVDLRLIACFNNGATSKLSAKIERTAFGAIDAKSMFNVPRDQLMKVAEQAVAKGQGNAADLVAKAKQQLKGKEEQRQVALLERWLKAEGVKLVDLASHDAANCFLSDAKWEKASSGWAGTPRDRWGAEPHFGQGLFLFIAGKLHEKGLPAHCPAEHVFATAGKWDRFKAIVGLRDGAGPAARSIFIVQGDGKELYRSEQLKPGKTEDIDLEISGVKQLQLVTKSGMQSTHTCWAVWGSPQVTRGESR